MSRFPNMSKLSLRFPRRVDSEESLLPLPYDNETIEIAFLSQKAAFLILNVES